MPTCYRFRGSAELLGSEMGMEWGGRASANDPIPDQLTVSRSKIAKTEIHFYLEMCVGAFITFCFGSPIFGP